MEFGKSCRDLGLLPSLTVVSTMRLASSYRGLRTSCGEAYVLVLLLDGTMLQVCPSSIPEHKGCTLGWRLEKARIGAPGRKGVVCLVGER